MQDVLELNNFQILNQGEMEKIDGGSDLSDLLTIESATFELGAAICAIVFPPASPVLGLIGAACNVGSLLCR